MRSSYETLEHLLRKSALFQQQADALADLRQQTQNNEMVLSVLGQFKRGKSSLINAMLGQSILPVAITPLTAVVTEIRAQAQAQAQVCFQNGTTQEIAVQDLDLYCGEKENPHNQKGVQTVRLWTPKHPFGAGTVLVDTPGVGSTNQDNTRTTMEYLIHSDAVVFVLSVDSPVHETELQFLMQAKQYTPNLYFAVNKSDLAAPNDLQEFLTYCRTVLESHLNRPVTLYPVSAKTGDGISDLLQLLRQDLSQHHDQMRSASADQKYALLLQQIQAILSVAEQTAAAPSEELREKRQRMEQQRKDLTAYGETLQVLAQHHTAQLVSSIAHTLRGQLDTLRQDTARHSEQLEQELSTLSLDAFKAAYQEKLEQFLKNHLNVLNHSGMSQLQKGFADTVALLTQHTNQTEACLSTILNEEFGVEYPLTTDHFEVSEREDFYVRVELQPMPRLYMDLKDHLTSRKTAQARFLKQCQQHAEENLTCNFNNMLYNYRYKMQESLRPLSRTLKQRIERVQAELEQLILLLDDRVQSAEQDQSEQFEIFHQIQQVLDDIRNP